MNFSVKREKIAELDDGDNNPEFSTAPFLLPTLSTEEPSLLHYSPVYLKGPLCCLPFSKTVNALIIAAIVYVESRFPRRNYTLIIIKL